MSISIQIIPHKDYPEMSINMGFTQTSVGYDRCDCAFNPTKDPKIRYMKAMMAATMEYIQCLKAGGFGPVSGDQARCFATAMTQLESAQMFAFKGISMGHKTEDAVPKSLPTDSPDPQAIGP